MNQQNNGNSSNVTNNDDSVREQDFVMSQSNDKRKPNNYDKKRSIDDANDYVFLKPVKKRRHSKGRDEYAPDSEIVFSQRGSSGRRRKRKKSRVKKIVLGVCCTLLALVIAVVGAVAGLYFNGQNQLNSFSNYNISAPDGVEVQNDGEYIVYNGETYKLNTNITNFLLMGIDKRELNDTAVNGTNGQADVIVLAALDTSTGKFTLINISRDTMTDVAVYSKGGAYTGTSKQQICLSYAYGLDEEKSCNNTVSSVSRLFYNIPINTYLSLDLDGISALNDSIGGVDVVSPETIGDFKEGESYHLQGESAESFVRIREHETPEGNSLRMKRQEVYVNQFINKIFSMTKQDLSTPLKLFNASADYTCTNLTPSRVTYLGGTLVKNGSLSVEMTQVPGEITMGEKYAEFNVDEKGFYELFLSIFYNKM